MMVGVGWRVVEVYKYQLVVKEAARNKRMVESVDHHCAVVDTKGLVDI